MSNVNIQLIRRKLYDNEIELVIKEIQNTVNITGYTKTEWSTFDSVLIVMYEDKFAGICLYFDIGLNWAEIAVLLVLPEFRGLGLGSMLFFESIQSLTEMKKSIYTTTRNPIVLKMMRKNNFKLVSLHQLPKEIQIFNLKFICSYYRIKEFFRKKMFRGELPSFVYGIKEI
jgi:GNAT superfamily N-acetyltransferase